MRRAAAIFFVMVLMVKSATASEEIDLQAVVRMYEERDLKRIQSTPPQALETLSLEQRNRAALVAAKSLSINQYIEAIGDDSIHKHFTKPSAQDSPAEAECRRQWGINTSAAELLRHLSEKRMINDPAVLPYLIDALNHPDRNFVGQPCFHALQYLTYHESGHAYWARLVEDAKRHAQVLSWWKGWWEENRHKHPVFEREVEGRLRLLVLDIAKTISTELKPIHPQLSEFSVPKQLRLHAPPSPLFHIEYNPRLLANIHPHGLDRDHLPWLYIKCEFKTPDLAAPPGWRRDERLPPLELRDHIRKVFYCEIDGTDIVISVKLASEQRDLIKNMERVLKRKKTTQQPPQRDK